ncbi:hypothetical protein D3C87_1517270 [compost metagenome]
MLVGGGTSQAAAPCGKRARRHELAVKREFLPAQVLVDRPAVVKAMRQRIAHPALESAIRVLIRLADKAITRDAAIRVFKHGPDHRQALLPHIAAFLIAGKDGEVRSRSKIQRQRRRDPSILEPNVVGGVMRVHRQRVQAESRLAVL